MKAMARRLKRLEASPAMEAMQRRLESLVWRENVEWVVSLGCAPHCEHGEYGRLTKDIWMARFTMAELEVLAAKYVREE